MVVHHSSGSGTGRVPVIAKPHEDSGVPFAQKESGPLAGTGIWAAGVAVVLTVHLIWAWLNNMPPIWDMAHHQRMGWSFMEAMRNGDLLSRFSTISNYYPPLLYLYEGMIFLIAGPTRLLAFLVNLPGVLGLSFFTFRIARFTFPPAAAAAAGILTLLAPLVAWTSRETLLDVSLSAWVAVAFYALLRSDFFTNRRWAIVFCLASAGGMMTKWMFALFLAPLVCWALARSRDRIESVLSLIDGTLLGLPFVLVWYLPNLNSLIQRFQLTAEGAGWEQDPGLASLGGWLYYPRSLSGYYLFLPLTLMAVWGFARLLRERNESPLFGFLLTALLGGGALLSLLEAKDPRYVMPLIAPLSIVLVGAVRDRARMLAAVMGFAFLQFLAVSFTVPYLPEKIAFFEVENDTDYIGMSREWVLFESNYFGVTGAPRREDWGYQEMLKYLPDKGMVGFVPDAPFFHPGALALRARQQGKDLNVVRIGTTEASVRMLEKVDWVVGKSGGQGISFITRFNKQVYEALESENWLNVITRPLPDETMMTIWQRRTRSQ